MDFRIHLNMNLISNLECVPARSVRIVSSAVNRARTEPTAAS